MDLKHASNNTNGYTGYYSDQASDAHRSSLLRIRLRPIPIGSLLRPFQTGLLASVSPDWNRHATIVSCTSVGTGLLVQTVQYWKFGRTSNGTRREDKYHYNSYKHRQIGYSKTDFMSLS